ncbi:MAG: glycosyltransferase, partial [Alphaproteobacteria bacterium]
LNCIPVVPGAVGAWRRESVLAAGGFRSDTLAEDADMTISIIRSGHRVVYEPDAIARTEAPASVSAFLKQRFRWMFGMLQVSIKHRSAAFERGKHAIGWVTLPNILIFQVFFPLVAPITDFTLISALGYSGWQWFSHPGAALQADTLAILLLYLTFLAIDYFSAVIAFYFEPKEQKSLLFWLFFQRFFYRPLLYYVAIKATLVAIRGSMVGWGKLERKATVDAA